MAGHNQNTSPFDVVLGFDMETDIGSWTPFYEGLINGTPRVLEALSNRDVKATCFFVGQTARDHPHIVHQVQQAGHEVGCHSLYHETVGQTLFPIPGITPLLDREVEPRLRLATEWVAEVSGVRPVSFRSPRLFGSTAVCNALDELGYVSDASYPLYHYGERLVPYHPSSADWTKQGDLRLIEIPNFADMSIESQDPYGRDRDQWPLFRTESAASLWRHIERHLKYCDDHGMNRPVLCFYFHPWEFWDMPEGLIHYGEGAVKPDDLLIRNCGDYAISQFAELLDRLINHGARFLTAAECAREWHESDRGKSDLN